MQTRSALVFLSIFTFPALAAAQGAGLELRYGPEQTVFGSCKPALTLVNRSPRALDYVQVDVAYRLKDGREKIAEHKSRYRTGLDNPVAPGEQRLLVIHHDESTPMGAACADIVSARIQAAECNGAAAAPCTALAPRIGETLALPQR
ncbi:MAG: hypothetical protein AB7R90_17820 [Reyranellaceae bacterium]